MRTLLIALVIFLPDRPDPGAAAFARGIDSLTTGDAAAAELEFTRCLDDAAIPPSRRARAHYNRGTVRTMQAQSVEQLASACDDLRLALSSQALPPELEADARNNLEVTKLFLAEARQREARDAESNAKRSTPLPTPAASDKPDTSEDSSPQPVLIPSLEPGSTLTAETSTPPSESLGNESAQENRAGNPVPEVDPPPIEPGAARRVIAEAGQRIARSRTLANQLQSAGRSNHARDW